MVIVQTTSIVTHEASQGHYTCILKKRAITDPSNYIAPEILVHMNQLTISHLMNKFKTVRYFGEKNTIPFMHYVTRCELDKSKALNVGSQYLEDKAAARFNFFSAEAER